MAFNSNPPQQKYTATAGQTTFPYLFKIFNENNIEVYNVGVGDDPELAVPLLLNVDYTVTIDGDNGGSVELAVGAEQDDTITIYRRLDIARYVDYQTSGDLLATTLNNDQDYQTYLTADLADAVKEEISGAGPGAPISDAVRKTGDTMTGALSVPSGAVGTQVVQAQEISIKVGESIETITDADGTAIKFPDGTMICHGTNLSCADNNSSSTNAFGDSSGFMQTYRKQFTFPATFISTPTVTTVGNTKETVSTFPWHVSTSTIEIFCHMGYGADHTLAYANYIAIGRWK